MTERESVRVLEECVDLQKRKSRDYQNDKSNVKQAMHYRRGVATIHDMISQKLLRAQSLLEAYEQGDVSEPNFEGLEDTYKDLINYASFAVSYLRGSMEGQDTNRDMLNRIKPVATLTREQWDKAVDSVTERVTGAPARYSINEMDMEEDYYFPPLSAVRKVTDEYVKRVHPVGPITSARGILGNIDPVKETYIEDIGDRIEGEYDELAKKHSER